MSNSEEKNKRIFRNTINNFRNNRMKQTLISESKMEIDVETRESRREFYNSDSWRKLRLEALNRDHHECVWCRDEGRVTRTLLEVDHIKELEYYPEHALDLDNLRTLCKECHNKRHNRFQFRKSSKMESRNFRTDEWWG